MATKVRRRGTNTAEQRSTQRRAKAPKAPTTLDDNARTVRAVIATDTPVQIYDDLGNGEYGYVDEVLLPGGMVAVDKLRLRLDHNTYGSRGVIGRVSELETNATEVTGLLHFSRAADVDEVFQRVREGNLDAVSVGATYRMKDTTTLQPGESATYAGTKYTATKNPMRIVQKWTPNETSVVDEGADPRAVIRSKQSENIRTRTEATQQLPRTKPGIGGATFNEGDDMTKTKRRVTRVGAQSASVQANQAASTERRAKRATVAATLALDNAALEQDNDDQGDEHAQTARAHHANRVAEIDRRADSRAAAAGATPEQADQIRRDERARVARIRELGQGQPDELTARAIEDGLSPEQFGLAVLERMRGVSAGHQTAQSGDGVNRAPAAHVRRNAPTEQSLQAGLLMRAGINLQNPVFATEQARVVLERQHCGWLYRMNADIADEGNSDLEQIIELGRRFSNDSAPRTCERLLTVAQMDGGDDYEETVNRAFSTPFLPRVFGSIVSVGLIQGYLEYQDSTVGWVAEADWSDFRQNQPIGIDATQGLRKHTPNTRAKSVDFADFGEAYAIARYTGYFAIDEIHVINDAVGMGQTVPQQLGEMAARLRPDLLYAAMQRNSNLADGNPWFHSSRGNVIFSNALSLDNLGKAEALMAAQTVSTKAGIPRPLNLMAGYLIVPRALRALGKQVVNSALVVSGSTTTQGNINPHDGEYQLRSDARLDIGVIDPDTETKTTGSTSDFFIAERSGQQAVQVGYRRGTGRAPSIRARPLMAPGEFGWGWDVAHDLGLGVLRPGAMVRSRSAAS
jgi:hypothetical protein